MTRSARPEATVSPDVKQVPPDEIARKRFVDLAEMLAAGEERGQPADLRRLADLGDHVPVTEHDGPVGLDEALHA